MNIDQITIMDNLYEIHIELCYLHDNKSLMSYLHL